MRRYLRSLALPFLSLALVALVAAVAWADEAKPADEGRTGAPALERVESVKVCMVNDQVFERDQIAVEVEGRTYYGCCEMCKERLARDAAARSAVDPLTGESVDKATAVIAARADGTVLYFASEENLSRYLTENAD